MSITDELRKWIGTVAWLDDGMHHTRDKVTAIADRIDAEHRAALEKLSAQVDEGELRQFVEKLRVAASEHADVTLFDVDYTPLDTVEETFARMVRLPLDADGVPIRVGDVMEWEDGETFEVAGFGGRALFFIDDETGDAEWTVAPTKHHHAPTVEDVLREFAEKIIDSQVPTVRPTYDEAIAEYAAKLRLAGDGE